MEHHGTDDRMDQQSSARGRETFLRRTSSTDTSAEQQHQPYDAWSHTMTPGSAAMEAVPTLTLEEIEAFLATQPFKVRPRARHGGARMVAQVGQAGLLTYNHCISFSLSAHKRTSTPQEKERLLSLPRLTPILTFGPPPLPLQADLRTTLKSCPPRSSWMSGISHKATRKMRTNGSRRNLLPHISLKMRTSEPSLGR